MDFGTAFASAWSSGISMYGVAALLGLAGRFGWIEAPMFLEQTWVIVVALVLFVVEWFVDKMAYIDSTWDAVHTVIRPLAGGYLLSTVTDSQFTVPALAATGVALAFSSHSAKATTRAFVNASPEPVSNVVVSLTEDGAVAAVMALAIAAPEVALMVTVVLAMITTIVAIVLFRQLRKLARRLRS